MSVEMNWESLVKSAVVWKIDLLGQSEEARWQFLC